MPFEYEGRAAVARFCASIFGSGRRFDLVPTRANGQPAFGAYVRDPNGISHGVGIYVLTLATGQLALDCLVLAGGRVPEEVMLTLKGFLSDEEILELTYITCLYDMHAVMTKALRLEFDDRDQRVY